MQNTSENWRLATRHWRLAPRGLDSRLRTSLPGTIHTEFGQRPHRKTVNVVKVVMAGDVTDALHMYLECTCYLICFALGFGVVILV